MPRPVASGTGGHGAELRQSGDDETERDRRRLIREGNY